MQHPTAGGHAARRDHDRRLCGWRSAPSTAAARRSSGTRGRERRDVLLRRPHVRVELGDARGVEASAPRSPSGCRRTPAAPGSALPLRGAAPSTAPPRRGRSQTPGRSVCRRGAGVADDVREPLAVVVRARDRDRRRSIRPGRGRRPPRRPDRAAPAGRSGRGRRRRGSSCRPAAARATKADPSRWPAGENSTVIPARPRPACRSRRLELRQRALRVALAVERQRRLVLRVAVLVRLARILFLDARRVRQHEAAQIRGAGRAEHAAPESVRNQPRQVADVIEVRVRQHDGVDRLGGTGKGSQFRSRSSFRPWNSPQSTSTRRPPCSSRYFEPVTVRAAPRNVS